MTKQHTNSRAEAATDTVAGAPEFITINGQPMTVADLIASAEVEIDAVLRLPWAGAISSAEIAERVVRFAFLGERSKPANSE